MRRFVGLVILASLEIASSGAWCTPVNFCHERLFGREQYRDEETRITFKLTVRDVVGDLSFHGHYRCRRFRGGKRCLVPAAPIGGLRLERVDPFGFEFRAEFTVEPREGVVAACDFMGTIPVIFSDCIPVMTGTLRCFDRAFNELGTGIFWVVSTGCHQCPSGD